MRAGAQTLGSSWLLQRDRVRHLLGIAIDWSSLDPIKALFWSAVINGVVAVPIMTGTMLVARRRKAMGKFVIQERLYWIGWSATGVMLAAVVAMFAVH